jgi:hypothetical protein
VQCRPQGVKLTFASGRELLFAADGALHLRSGERCAPFTMPVALQLGDGSAVHIRRGGSRRAPIEGVTVTDGERALGLWRNGEPAAAECRPPEGLAVRLVCAGGGDVLYRVETLGPLVAFERVLGPEVERTRQPLRRVAILTTPLLRSLPVLLRRYAKPEPAVADAVKACATFAAIGRHALDPDVPMQPVGPGRSRWVLPGGFELSLDPGGRGPIRLALHAADSPAPFVEWSVGYTSTVYLLNPKAAEGARWYRRREPLRRVETAWTSAGEYGEVDAIRAIVQRIYGDR